MAASRIGAATPFSPTIEVPFYDRHDLSAPPVLRQYQLKVAIAHAGNQLNSGHYTAIAWQKYKAAADGNYEDTWVLYNDSQLNRYHPDLEKANSVVNHLTSRAYYLAYELIPLD
jgi:ubiquitin C-terminal hydrolase